MALEFLDGFDHFNNDTNLALKWAGATSFGIVTFPGGRFGGNAADFLDAYVTVVLTAQATRTAGFAFRTPSVSISVVIAHLLDSGSAQLDLRLNSGGALSVTRNGTVLGTSTATLTASTWYYIEWKSTIHSSAGAYEVKLDGVSILSGSSANTQNTANASANQFRIGAPGTAGNFIRYDDLYVLDSTGAVNNTFLGDCRIYTSMPSADGASSSWTPSTGTSHYALVDEVPPNGDSDYVSSGTVGQIDTYQYPDISPSGVIAGVQVTLTDRKDDAAARTICAEYRSGGGTNYDGATAHSPTTSYAMHRQVWQTDPATSAAWTAANINAGEFGCKVVS